jgi:tetratricopeptide (TPR) repeat protein
MLYLGFDTVPLKQKALEKSRSLQLEVTGTQNILDNALGNLDNEDKTIIEALNLDIEKAENDSLRINRLKVLASTWYEFGHPSASAIYAEQIAELNKSEESWSIAGTTYMICARTAQDDTLRQFCSARALKSLEMAISLNPDNVEPKINQALVFVDNPDKENPMKGILMLRELQEKYPENTAILNQLAILALKTNQIDKALERLNESFKIDPKNNNTICLLADAWEMAGNPQKAKEFKDQCKS